MIDTLANFEMDAAPAKTTQVIQQTTTTTTVSATVHFLVTICIYKCEYHDHYQTYWIVPPLPLAVFVLKSQSLISTALLSPVKSEGVGDSMRRAPVVTTQVIQAQHHV